VRNPTIFVIGFLLVVMASASSCRSQQMSPAGQAVSAYAEKEAGFRTQVKEIVEAYQGGDDAKGHRLIEKMRLPNADKFFAENFAQGESVKLADRYARAFNDYALSLEHTVKDVVHNPGSRLKQNLVPGNPTVSDDMRDKLASLTPYHGQKLYRLGSTIELEGHEVGSWEDTYLYRDGRFVYIGFGGWPIWSWQETTESNEFINGHFVTPAVLIQKIPPTYPPDARKLKVEGTVVLKFRIGKDGGVENVGVISGDPLLVPAAVEAVRQWRFRPWNIGGIPFEYDTTVSVEFSLRGK